MKLVGKTLAVAAMLLTGACDVTVNNKSVDDTVAALGESIDNRVDINVDLDGKDAPAESNKS